MLVQKLPHEITCVLNPPVHVSDDDIMHTQLVCQLQSVGHDSEHVDRSLHQTETSQVNDEVVRLDFAWNHGVLDCVASDEIESVHHHFIRHSEVERAFNREVDDGAILFVPLEPVESAGLEKFLHLVRISKHRHLVVLNPLLICKHTIVGGLEIVLMRNQEP